MENDQVVTEAASTAQTLTDPPVISLAADIARAYREGYLRARHDAHQEQQPIQKTHLGIPVAMASATADRRLLDAWQSKAMQHFPDPA